MKIALIGCSGVGKTTCAKSFGFNESIDYDTDVILDFTKPQNGRSLIKAITEAKSPVVACSVFPFGLKQIVFIKKIEKLPILFVYLSAPKGIIESRLANRFRYTVTMPDVEFEYMDEVCLSLKDKIIDTSFLNDNETIIKIKEIFWGI
jgi:gluconate kinase